MADNQKQYEFMEELPNTQQAAPVTTAAQEDDQTDTRPTAAMTEGQTEPEKVDHDKAIDTSTLDSEPPHTHSAPDISAETEIPKVDNPVFDDPEYAGGDQTDTRVTEAMSEGQKEPEKVETKNAIAEPQEDQLTPEQKRMDNPPVSPAEVEKPEPEKKPVRRTGGRAKKVAAEPEKSDKKADDKPAKTDNPKLKRLKKYGE